MNLKMCVNTLGMAGMLIGSVAWSQPFDDILGACSPALTAEEQRVVRGTTTLVNKARISQNTNGTYNVQTVSYVGSVAFPLCPTNPFYGTRTFEWGRSGFLVADDLVVTAPHTTGFNIDDFLVVFDLIEPESGNPACGLSDFTQIPAAKVYEIDEISYINLPDGNGYDYAVLRLDRAVTDRSPLRIRRSGEPTPGDPIVNPSAISRLGLKIATDAIYLGVDEDGFGEYQGLRALAGSSGGPVFNTHSDLVEAVIARGSSLAVHVPGAGLCNYWITIPGPQTPNGNIGFIAAHVPRHETLVSPLQGRLHILPVGGSISSPTTYTSIDPADTVNGDWVRFDLSEAVGPPGTPFVESAVPDGTYLLNTPSNVPFTARTTGVTSCGVWERTINLIDKNSNWNNKLLHRFEIGLTETEMLPIDGWSFEELGAPFNRVKSYTIENTRPTPVTIRVGSIPSWMTVSPSVGAQPSAGRDWLDINLAATGQPNSTTVVQLALHPVNYSGILGDSPLFAALTFTHQGSTCPVGSPEVRTVEVVRKRETFTNLDEGPLPPPAPGHTHGTPFEIEFDLSDQGALLVKSVVAEAGFWFFNGDLHQMADAIKVELESPDGHTQVLWNGQSIPVTGNYVRSESVPGASIDFLRFDQSDAPPLGGGSLTSFINRSVSGTWKLRYYAESGAPPNGYAIKANLTFTSY